MRHVIISGQDISHAVPRDSCKCAVARAIGRFIRPGVWLWVVAGEAIFRVGMGRSIRVPLPEAVRRFVRAFDAGLSVQPIGFDLQIPREVAL